MSYTFILLTKKLGISHELITMTWWGSLHANEHHEEEWNVLIYANYMVKVVIEIFSEHNLSCKTRRSYALLTVGHYMQ